MRTIRTLLALLVAEGVLAAADLNKAILRAVFARSLGKGTYTVKWRALADDGHHESGSWTFKVS
jgi:methionine-rich copper-binding protein CopC